MMNILDNKLTDQQKELACKVLKTLRLDHLKVMAEGETLHFIQDRRVVHIPLSLIVKEQWADIRFLCRSILKPEPAVWNHTNLHRPFESY